MPPVPGRPTPARRRRRRRRSRSAGITIGGYIQADAIFSEAADDDSEPAGTFVIPRARVGLSGDITSKVSWTVVGDFANLTSDGRILRDAYVQFTANPQFAVRFGQMVAPFSLERLTGYTKLEVIDRSVIGAAMAPSRDIGLMVFNVRAVARLDHLRRGDHQRHRAEPRRRQQRQGSSSAASRRRVPRVSHLTLGVNAQTGEQAAGRSASRRRRPEL